MDQLGGSRAGLKTHTLLVLLQRASVRVHVHVRLPDNDGRDGTTPGFLPLAPGNQSQTATPEQRGWSVLKAPA